MDKYDTSQLTEFPRFEPESSQSGVSTFFTKLWKFPIFSPSETSENLQEKVASEGKQEPQQTEDQSKQDYDDAKTETGSYAVEFEGRSLPNVLKRISSLVALGSGGGTRYADTELARYWMPDDISRECYECAARFSTLRRRHHCRVCGQIFCSRCCSQRVPGQIFGCADGLRVCNYCCNIVLSYLRENDMTGEISPDLRTLQENLQVKFPDNKSQSSSSKGRQKFMFAREQEERCEARATPKETLQDIYRQLAFTLPTQQHRYRLVRYNGVWRGCDMLQWIMENTSNKTRVEAMGVCRNLVQAGYVECVSELASFADYALYRGTVRPGRDTGYDKQDEECTRLVESVSSYCLDLNLGNNSARLIKAPKTEVKSSPSSEEENPVLETNEGYTETVKICKAISECGEEHLKLLMRQCVAREGLPASWLPILYPLCQQAADIIMPEMNSSDMDVRHYVQVKKVVGGAPRDCSLVRGLVLTKNVAHRGMPQEISNPTVLLLDCSIAYQRVEGKLTSLEPVLLQEQQYLVRCAARICALRPGVVLVGGTAARGVQDALRAAGVALATRVPQRALRRAARCTRADLVTSIDARIGTPKLGTATSFYVKNYSSKTLMILEDCAEPNLGCCILLHGASLPELIRVKKVVKFMLLACYNWKLERAFLGDIEATLPEPGMTFEDDDNENDDKKEKDNEKEDIFDLNNDMTEPKTDLTDKIENVLSNVEEDDSKMFKSESCDDPLQKKSYTRKTDSEKNFSGVPIQDFSDPLHSRLSVDDEVFLPKEEVILKADDTHTDRWTTDDVVLSMSPNVIIPAPYLETEAGKRCSLRAYLPRVSAASQPRVPPHTPKSEQRRLSRPNQPSVVLKDMHPFTKNPITTPCDDPANKAALAHFRATGCRLVTNKHNMQCPLYKPSVIKQNHKLVELEVEPQEKQEEPLDPLAPENHQRLSLLLYSYCNKSANVPDFCVNPWIVTMEMYGRHDISLGAFLEKYCFNSDYKCPSTNCQVPMNQHIRRFVHGDVCITISCNTIGHSNVDKLKEESSKQVMFWSRCQRCGAHGRAVRTSACALALSLGTYLRLRARAPRYVRAHACPHPLNAHTHAFAKGLTTACFRFSKISTYDIELPPEVIATRYDTRQMRETLIQQLNELMHKGHETFSGVSDIEADADYQTFKQHMEQIHLALTASSLGEQNSLAAVVRSLWSVSDRIITGEKMLRDAQDKWSSPVSKAAKPTVETSVEEKDKEKSDLEDSAGEGAEDNSKDEKEHTSTGAEEDEEKGDKKTVRQILSQLLSNNQPSHQSGIIISGGAVPVVVAAGEIGSVIAATLASVAYQRSLRNSAQPECEDTDNSGSSKDKPDGEKSNKAAKASDHFEVLLKDGLLCRVYYPQQFQKLRHMLLAPLNSNSHITDEFARHHDRATGDKCGCEDSKENKSLCDIEEGFIRSLAHCVPWAARGGKSGSTFCKTEDDRYVLKEMTKPEWQQFLEFAPHYFNYITNCHQNKQPSLLARILGVYSVGGAGNGVLVMENIWYSCSPNTKRFDLKGSSRHRFTSDTQPLSVLMDENLLNLRWETQLYVQSHVGSVIWTCIERDTAFLAQHAVMDYSLLLGIDNRKLVLGVIDYIRTFTWDKKLEHLVKKNLGSGQPTVVSPADYKRRFSVACRKYFLQCPAHWDHLTPTTYA